MLTWAGVFHVLRAYGALALPRAIAGELTLETYLGIVHVLTIAVGLTLTWLVVPEPRAALALQKPCPRAFGVALGLLPLAFVLGTAGAFLIARPTLIEELLRGGQEAVQRNTGEFGRQLVEAPVPLVLLWGAVISPISEELFFRGALWSLVADGVRLLASPSGVDAPPPSLPAELVNDGPGFRFGRAVRGWLVTGGVATLAVSTLFGVLHKDMPGGLGIVRFVSALVLGFTCSLARQHGRSVWPAMAVHVLWNFLSVAAVRRWIVTETFPTKYGAPTLVVAIAAVTTIAVVAGLVAGRSPAGHSGSS